MKTKFDKIYVISLITNHDRQDAITEQLKGCCDLDFEFVYGSDYYNFINDAHNHKIKYPNVYPWVDDNDAEHSFSRSFGCAITHYNAVLYAYELGYNNVLIMEDDVCFVKNKKLIYNSFNNIPEDADFITWDPRFVDKFETNLPNIKEDILNSNDLFFNITNEKYPLMIGGMMYAIMNRQSMEFYLKTQHENFHAADIVLNFFYQPTVKKYVSTKCIATDQYNIENNFSGKGGYQCIYTLTEKLNNKMFYNPDKFTVFSRY